MGERYTLKQVAKMLKVHYITIYRWEKKGLVAGPKRLARTRERVYFDEDVARLAAFRDRLIDPIDPVGHAAA